MEAGNKIKSSVALESDGAFKKRNERNRMLLSFKILV